MIFKFFFFGLEHILNEGVLKKDSSKPTHDFLLEIHWQKRVQSPIEKQEVFKMKITKKKKVPHTSFFDLLP